jgi:hypothetical protein
MRETFIIDRHTRVIKKNQKLLIIFKGNVNSIGSQIPIIASFIAGIFIYYFYISDSIKAASDIAILFLVFLVSISIGLAEMTLKYEIYLDEYALLLSTSRLGIKVEKRLLIQEITSIEKNEVIGQIGDSIVCRSKLCISDSQSKNIIPVTLDDDGIDEIIKLIQEFIAKS